jgi:hypothetical protein
MEVRKACRFLHDFSCRVRRRERILEEYLFVFRLTFFLIEGKKRAKSTIKTKSACLALISLASVREEGRRAFHDYLIVYVMYTYRGMERKQVESGDACEREEVCVFDKCDPVSETCVRL